MTIINGANLLISLHTFELDTTFFVYQLKDQNLVLWLAKMSYEEFAKLLDNDRERWRITKKLAANSDYEPTLSDTINGKKRSFIENYMVFFCTLPNKSRTKIENTERIVILLCADDSSESRMYVSSAVMELWAHHPFKWYALQQWLWSRPRNDYNWNTWQQFPQRFYILWITFCSHLIHSHFAR